MGMDAGTVTGKGESVFRDEPVPKGREDGGKSENLLEPFLIMEREFRVVQGISGNLIRDAGMLIGKFLSLAGFFRRLSIFVFWEKVLPAGLLGGFGLWPEPVHQVKVRTQWRKGILGTACQGSQETVSLEFQEPGCQTGETKHYHKDKGTDDLRLVFCRPADRGIERGKVFHYRIKVEQAEFLPDRAEFEQEPCTLGRIKMYFCLMQEI